MTLVLMTISDLWSVPTSHLLAAGFVAPAFAVAGLLLASIPIIIHLLNRRRFKVVEWAAMSFLLAALKRNRRRMQLEQWLLLATRCVLVVLLGLALARPVSCEQTGLAAGAMRSGLHVLVIDNSYSMAYQAGRSAAATHLDQAKLLARQLVEQMSSGGESVAVVTAAQPATVLLPPTYDLAAAAKAIDRIEQSSGGTDLPGAMVAALAIGRENARQPMRRLELFTDATRAAWEPREKARLAQLGRDAGELFRVRHFNLSRADQWNAAATELSPAAALVRVGFNSDLSATVRAFGRSVSGTVQWSLDGQTIADGSRGVELGPETPPITQSQARFRVGGAHTIGVSVVADDRLKVDDARFRVVQVAAGMKVLIVEGDRGSGALASSGTFLALALAPPAEIDAARSSPGDRPATSSYLLPELVSEIELSNRVLTDYRAIVLAGVGDIDSGQAEQLRRFVSDGGTLILFMGDTVKTDSYNQTLLPAGLLPGMLTKRVTAAADQRGFGFDFKPLGALHPLLKIFSGQENTGLETAQVFTYVQVDLPADSKVERVLDYVAPGGAADPAITLHQLGAGRVVFISTTANAEWTSLPAKPAYVALMHELLAGSVSAGDAWMNRLVGEPLEVPPTIPLKAAPTLTDPSGQSVALQQQPSADGRSVHRSGPLKKPGVYQLNTGAATFPIAVNCPSEEADIRPLADAAIRAALGGIEVDLQADQVPVAALAQQSGNDFGWIAMLLVLGLVGAESFMAMRFGHHRTGGAGQMPQAANT